MNVVLLLSLLVLQSLSLLLISLSILRVLLLLLVSLSKQHITIITDYQTHTTINNSITTITSNDNNTYESIYSHYD